MIIETAIILALGTVVPPCDGELFRAAGRLVCIENRSTRGTQSFIPRRSERPIFEKTRNRGYTKVRNITKPNKPFGVNRYTRRTKRSIVREYQHVLQSRDIKAENARRVKEQQAYSDKRKR